MIKIDYHLRFEKHYQKRIKSNKKLDYIFRKRVEQFVTDPECRELRNHQLIGKKRGIYSFWITGDMRCLYQWIDKERVLFLDVGSHNQVY